MSRIRSVHPGLFTDEAFVCLSDAAQVFFIGLWTECDDQGAFEWKPVQLRLKLRGNKDGGVEPILAELEEANCIKAYQYEGRKYGLVRNFQRFQRPKKPNSIHFIPPEFRTYVGLKSDGSEPTHHSDDDSSDPVPHQFPTSGEKSPQMEDGGGRREKEEEGGRERARARKPEASHGKRVAEILSSSASTLDQWEIDFLRSIRAKSNLTKAQTESLKGIEGKLANATCAPSEPSRSTVWVWKDSPQWDAWSKGRARPWPTKDQQHPDGGLRPGWYFPAEWPSNASTSPQEAA